jgi:hypothetical protein
MAMQFMGILMKSKGNVAILAMWYPTAGLANLVGRIPTPVLKKDHLFSLFQRLINGVF